MPATADTGRFVTEEAIFELYCESGMESPLLEKIRFGYLNIG
jgi:hypothetical protein